MGSLGFRTCSAGSVSSLSQKRMQLIKSRPVFGFALPALPDHVVSGGRTAFGPWQMNLKKFLFLKCGIGRRSVRNTRLQVRNRGYFSMTLTWTQIRTLGLGLVNFEESNSGIALVIFCLALIKCLVIRTRMFMFYCRAATKILNVTSIAQEQDRDLLIDSN